MIITIVTAVSWHCHCDGDRIEMVVVVVVVCLLFVWWYPVSITIYPMDTSSCGMCICCMFVCFSCVVLMWNEITILTIARRCFSDTCSIVWFFYLFVVSVGVSTMVSISTATLSKQSQSWNKQYQCRVRSWLRGRYCELDWRAWLHVYFLFLKCHHEMK